ncbi:hypothetical protein CSAL01_05795 [Colletotrichum salicis]|uniref:Uncharacterized protein n=1 Tax=Colletotrichum salicis TaxID=1209931 RepID=A0A135SNZ8_9PEZI|nr:hypothetical protein CSAL01_05795 [Colletotrichum salicis]
MASIGSTLFSASKAQNKITTTLGRMSLDSVPVLNQDSANLEEQQPTSRDDFTIFDYGSQERFRPANGDIDVRFEDGTRVTVSELQGTVSVLHERSPNIMGRAIDHNRDYGRLPVTVTREHAFSDERLFEVLHLLHPDPDQATEGRYLTTEKIQRYARNLSMDAAIDQLHDPLIYKDRQGLRHIVRLLDIRRQELLHHGISVDENMPNVELPENVYEVDQIAIAGGQTFDYPFLLRAIEAIDTVAQSIWYYDEEEQEENNENIPPELLD